MFAIGDREWPGISKLVEEAGEVGQVCGKLMGTRGAVDHWDGSDLRERLMEETGDLLASDGSVRVRATPEREFEIRRKGHGFPVGYAVFVGGRRKTAYRIMGATSLLAWLSSLRPAVDGRALTGQV